MYAYAAVFHARCRDVTTSEPHSSGCKLGMENEIWEELRWRSLCPELLQETLRMEEGWWWSDGVVWSVSHVYLERETGLLYIGQRSYTLLMSFPHLPSLLDNKIMLKWPSLLQWRKQPQHWWERRSSDLDNLWPSFWSAKIELFLSCTAAPPQTLWETLPRLTPCTSTRASKRSQRHQMVPKLK